MSKHLLLKRFIVYLYNLLPKIMCLVTQERNVVRCSQPYTTNENCGQRQAKNSQGRPLFKVVFPKYKKGGYIVRKVLSNPTYKYVDRLMCSVIEGCQQPLAQRAHTSELQIAEEPPSLSSVWERPEKDEAVQQHLRRFESK